MKSIVKHWKKIAICHYGISVSKDLGFVKGHKYEVLATRIIGGKDKVYAKGVVALK